MIGGSSLADWIPLLRFPVEWAALALLATACLYWERAGFTGIGVEGAAASAALGLILGYEYTGQYALAFAVAAGAALAFALLAGALLEVTRADAAVGSFALALAPICGLGLLTRSGPFRIFEERPHPGLVSGTVLDGTYAEDLVLNPLLVTAPIAIALSAWVLWRTPFGLRLRAFGENPGLGVPGSSGAAHRFGALAVGALLAAPAAGLLARAHPSGQPWGLGFVALACVIAGRWSLAAGVLLAAGPALARTARPYAEGSGGWAVGAEVAPYALALLYLACLSRRALRLAQTKQTRVDPDAL